MPRYIEYGRCNTEKSSGCCSKSASEYETSVNFFSQMSEKLTAMVSTVKTQFDDYRAQIDKFTTPKGIVSKVDTPGLVLGVGQEYLEYIKRFGPPPNGVWDPAKIAQLRIELGIQ